jgi:hypothetical protein
VGQWPAGNASPCGLRAAITSVFLIAGWAAAVRAAASTVTPFRRDRSMSMPPSRKEAPIQLWPPARTAMCSPRERASCTAWITSASEVTVTITSGNRSGTRWFQTMRRRVAS